MTLLLTFASGQASIDRGLTPWEPLVSINGKESFANFLTFERHQKDYVVVLIEFPDRKCAERFWELVSLSATERVTIEGQDWEGWCRLDGKEAKFWGYRKGAP